jgi:hypothetical protein
MLIENIKPALRNSITGLDLPIYITLDGNQCRPPGRLALGDSLMLLGLVRNYGRPVRLFMDPLPAVLPLLNRHPLIKEVLPPLPDSNRHLQKVAVGRSGRAETWHSRTVFKWDIPVWPLDKIRANPILAHSMYYQLRRRDDWPSVMPDDSASVLRGMLSRRKPALAVFPLNPGRADAFWQDEAWWLRLFAQLKNKFRLLGVGAQDYGSLAAALDAALPLQAPESSLPNIAWLISNCAGFIGRDGGLAHLATAVNHNVLTVWDSMGSYRYWAGSRSRHIVMSNPYIFRYPQAGRLNPDDLYRDCRKIQFVDGGGRAALVEMPADPRQYDEKARQIFGGIQNLAALILGQREQQSDAAGVEDWMRIPAVREDFYQQSLEFAVQAVSAQQSPGAAWIAPWEG